MASQVTPRQRAVLADARTRIARGWCQGAEARTSRGAGCAGTSPHAAAWCLFEALWLAAEPYRRDVWWRVRDRVEGAIGEPHLTEWNDAPTRTQADVLAVLDRLLG